MALRARDRLVAALSALSVATTLGARPGWAAEDPQTLAPKKRLALWAPRDPALARSLLGSLAAEELRAPIPEAESAFWLGASAPVPPQPPLAEIKQAVDRARRAFQRFRLEETSKGLSAADQGLEAWRGLPEALDLERDVLADLVSLAHAEREEARLDQALARYAARFPGEGPPPRAPWPPALTERLGRQPTPGPATLVVRANAEGARVWLDGRPIGTAPLTLTQLTEGPHRVVVEAQRMMRFDKVVAASGAQPTELDAKLQPDLGPELAKASLERGLSPLLLERLRAVLLRAGIDEVLLAERAGPGARYALVNNEVGPPRSAQSLTLDGPAVEQALRTLFHGPEGPAGEVAPWWSYAALGAGVGVAAIGLGFRVSAASQERDFTANHGALTQVGAAAQLDAVDTAATRGSVLVGLGVGVAVVSAGYLVYRWLGDGP
jgi:hypothetical protein